MGHRINNIRILQCLIAIICIYTFINFMTLSGVSAQWSTFSGGYGYPGSFYSAYPYIGDGNYSRYVSLGGFLVPREVFELLASSNWDTAQLGYSLIKPYFQAAVMSGWTPWSSPYGYQSYYKYPWYGGYSGYGLYGGLYSSGYFGAPYSGFYGSGLGDPLPDPRFPGSGLVIPPPVIWITPTEGYSPFTGARVMASHTAT